MLKQRRESCQILFEKLGVGDQFNVNDRPFHMLLVPRRRTPALTRPVSNAEQPDRASQLHERREAHILGYRIAMYGLLYGVQYERVTKFALSSTEQLLLLLKFIQQCKCFHL